MRVLDLLFKVTGIVNNVVPSEVFHAPVRRLCAIWRGCGKVVALSRHLAGFRRFGAVDQTKRREPHGPGHLYGSMLPRAAEEWTTYCADTQTGLLTRRPAQHWCQKWNERKRSTIWNTVHPHRMLTSPVAGKPPGYQNKKIFSYYARTKNIYIFNSTTAHN